MSTCHARTTTSDTCVFGNSTGKLLLYDLTSLASEVLPTHVTKHNLRHRAFFELRTHDTHLTTVLTHRTYSYDIKYEYSKEVFLT